MLFEITNVARKASQSAQQMSKEKAGNLRKSHKLGRQAPEVIGQIRTWRNRMRIFGQIKCKHTSEGCESEELEIS